MKETLYSTKFLNLVASKRKGKADWVYAHRPNAKNVVIIVPGIHKTDADYTMFLTTSLEYAYLSSSSVKEVASLNGDISKFVPELVADAIHCKINRL